MGGFNKGLKKTILSGKANYSLWLPATVIELKTEECYQAITDTGSGDPDKLSDAEKAAAIVLWLSGREPIPEGGFKAEKVASHTQMWKTQAKKDYQQWVVMDNKAQGVIFNLCNDTAKVLIAHAETAAEQLETLKEAYEQSGLQAVYRQQP
jgi:hypothetical protein